MTAGLFYLERFNMSMSVDVQTIAATEIRKVLSQYLKEEKNIERATGEVLSAISRLLQSTPASTNKLGATVMTESASMRTGRDGLPGIPPRTL